MTAATVKSPGAPRPPGPNELPLPDGGRTLVLGAGGGFDVVAAEMVRRALRRRSPARALDLAGMLNPKFEHHYVRAGGIVSEQAINRAAGVVRFRRARRDEPQQHYARRLRDGRIKPMPDAALARAVDGPIYQLSTRFGLDELAGFVARYDTVLACDVGGDILYGGPRDNAVRTPLIDAFTLALLRRARAQGTATYMLLLAPGSDGELSPDRLGSAIAALGRRGALRGCGRPAAADLATLAALLEVCRTPSGGTTLQLMLAVRAAVIAGARLPTRAERDMERYRPWIDRAYLFDAAAVWSHNPLAAGDSFEEIAEIAAALGWTGEGALPERIA